MNLIQYQPLNTKESIDLLIEDLQNGKLKYTSIKQAEIDCNFQIRGINLQLYFKQRFAELHLVELESITNAKNKFSTNSEESVSKKKNLNKWNIVKSKDLGITKSRKELRLEKEEKDLLLRAESLINKADAYKTNGIPKNLPIDRAIKKIQESNLKVISGTLGWPVKLLLNIFEIKGITKDENDKLTEDDYLIIKEIVEMRLNKIINKARVHNCSKLRKNKGNPGNWNYENQIPLTVRKKNDKMKKGSSSNSESVYDIATKYGVGKIISIRSK